MIMKNMNLKKSLLVLLILILPASIYTFTSVTAQGVTQGFASENTTGIHTGSHNNLGISAGNSSAARAHGTNDSQQCLTDPASCNA